jgi:hypothetical protein
MYWLFGRTTAPSPLREILILVAHPKPSARNEPGEFEKFSSLLDRILSVPHSKIKDKLDAERAKKGARSKRASPGHASGEKD